MNAPNDRRRAPFLGFPVFETFALLTLIAVIAYMTFNPLMRWLFH